MAEYIECRNCDSPNCEGCNILALAKMLHDGKFDCLMDANHSVERFADVEPVRHARPLTLEELRQMDGSPVWVEVLDHSVFANEEDDFDGWGLVRKSWVRVWDEKRADLVKVDYHFEDYGKEWRAYSLPVRHGRWLEVKRYDGYGLRVMQECNVCGCCENWLANYCPNCGAKMDLEVNDG